MANVTVIPATIQKYTRIPTDTHRKCETPHLYEDDIKELFLKAVSELLSDRSTLLGDCEALCSVLKDSSEYDEKMKQLEA